MFYFLVNPHRVDCKTKRKKVSVIKRLANEAESDNIVVTNLKTGLKQQEVESLRTQYGANEFTKPKERGLLFELLDVFKEPLMVILFIASGMSFLVGEYQDGIGICMAVLLGIIIGRVTEGRSKKAAESLAGSDYTRTVIAVELVGGNLDNYILPANMTTTYSIGKQKINLTLTEYTVNYNGELHSVVV